MEKPSSLSVLYMSGVDTVVIKKAEDSSFFITSDDSVIISRQALLVLLKFLVQNEVIHPKAIYGLLEEMNTV